MCISFDERAGTQKNRSKTATVTLKKVKNKK
jgi:hypothetical protein